MKELLFYNTTVATHERNHHLPGMERYAKFFSIYPKSSIFIDRSGVVKTPIRSKALHPIPELRPFNKTYEDVCNERAAELLHRADTLDVSLHVAWSGGIDSTLILVSLLKIATLAQKRRIVVLLTLDSIAENPNFYAEHIRGKLRCDSMNLFMYLLGTKEMLIGGENNDQVFGSDVSMRLINMFGPGIIHEKYRREVFFDFFNSILEDENTTNFTIDLMQRINAKALVPLVTLYDHLWWLSFCVKWQFVVVRMLAYTAPRNAHNITADYVRDRCNQFYNTPDFQLWSMSNMDKKIKDTWETYKYPAKDIIYAYTKDVDYWKNKRKRGSLGNVFQQQRPFNFLDSSFKLYHEIDANEYYEPENDFR